MHPLLAFMRRSAASVDPSQWIGWWPCLADVNNKITGAPGSALNIDPDGFNSYTQSSHVADASTGYIDGTSSSAQYRAANWSGLGSLSQLTVGFMARRETGFDMAGFWIQTASFTTFRNFESPAQPSADGNYHSVIVTMEGGGGGTTNVRYYLDGSLAGSASSLTAASYNQLIMATGENGLNANSNRARYRHVFITREVLSADAIAAIAAGAVPGTDGSL